MLLLRKPNQIQFDYLINSFKGLQKENVNVNFIKNIYKEYKNSYEAYKNLFFIKDIHWNKRGNAKVAKEILNKVNF